MDKNSLELEKKQLSETEIRARRIASWASLIVGALLMLVKFWAHNMTHSQSIFSDAMESIVNIIAAAGTLVVVRYSARPVDQDHPYGHGKVEYVSSAFEGGLITFAGVIIVLEAFQALIRGETLQQLDIGMGIVMAAGVANLLLGLFLVRSGKKNKSKALEASGKHVISDFWTSFAVFVGLLLVLLTGIHWLDGAFACVVGFWLSWTGVKIIRDSARGLLDEEDLDILRNLVRVFNKYAGNGIIQIHQVKTIRAGWFHHIDAHVVLPEFWTVLEVHEKMLRFEKQVFKDYPFSGEINFHTDPCRRAYCRVCDLKNCPVRQEDFEERLTIKLEHLRSAEEPKLYR